MLRLCNTDPSYVDVSDLISSWEEAKQLLRPHPLNPVKSSLSFYSVLNREMLGDVLAALHKLVPVYIFDQSRKVLLVHHGALFYMLCLLDLTRFKEQGDILLIEAVRMRKRAGEETLVLLRAADEALDIFEDWQVTIDMQVFAESYDEYKKMRHIDCPPDSDCSSHGSSLNEFTSETIERLMKTAINIIRIELEISSPTIRDSLTC